MNEFQQKKRLRKILYSRTSLVILTVIAILMIRGSLLILEKERQSKNNMDAVEAKLAVAKQREIALQNDINHLSTPEGTESEIRQKFSVKKDGEDIIIVVEPRNSTSTDEVRPSLWKKIGNWLRSIF